MGRQVARVGLLVNAVQIASVLLVVVAVNASRVDANVVQIANVEPTANAKRLRARVARGLVRRKAANAVPTANVERIALALLANVRTVNVPIANVVLPPCV